MGCDAYVMGMGKYSPKVSQFLEYPMHFYADTEIGTVVFTEILHCATSEQSQLLADALGVTLWDFSTHFIQLEKVDFAALKEVFNDTKIDQDVRNMRLLKEQGFLFFFRPNG